jgi:hypothetical protein
MLLNVLDDLVEHCYNVLCLSHLRIHHCASGLVNQAVGCECLGLRMLYGVNAGIAISLAAILWGSNPVGCECWPWNIWLWCLGP